MKKNEKKLTIVASGLSYATAVSATCLGILSSNIVFAEGEAEKLLGLIISLIGTLAFALAVVFAAMGAVSFASSQAEGDGPAKTKAIGQIAAAIMLIAVGIALRGKFGEELIAIFKSI